MASAQNKIIGYLLLIVGLGMIFEGVFSAYGVFAGQNIPPEIFKIEDGKVIAPPEKIKAETEAQNENDPQKQLQSAIGKEISAQLKEMLPMNFLLKIMNLASWSVFIGILIFAGSQVSGLGIKLVKD